jgi:glycosyltransferase involved in cell wall biosynthesis
MPAFLFVVPRFHSNLFFATRALVEAGHRVAVFANGRGVAEDHRIVAPRLFGETPGYAEVRAALAEVRPDLVFVRNAVALSRHAAVAARAAGVRALLYNQTPLTEPTGWRRRWELRLKRLPVRRVTPVRGLDRTAPTDPWARYLPWPVAALPAAEPPPGDGRLRVLCVGRLGNPKKNQIGLIEEIDRAGLWDRIDLRLVGSEPEGLAGEQAAWRDRLRTLAAARGVQVAANVPFAAMADHYAAAEVCVLPSRFEKLGTAPVEAMAHGAVPVIASVCGSAGYLVDGETGLVVDVDRPGAFGAALARLAGDRALVARLSAAARAEAEGALGPARFVARAEALAAGAW